MLGWRKRSAALVKKFMEQSAAESFAQPSSTLVVKNIYSVVQDSRTKKE